MRIIEFIGFSPYDPALPLSKKVVIWRSYNGLTQKETANLAGIDPCTLSRLERNQIRSSSKAAIYASKIRTRILERL